MLPDGSMDGLFSHIFIFSSHCIKINIMGCIDTWCCMYEKKPAAVQPGLLKLNSWIFNKKDNPCGNPKISFWISCWILVLPLLNHYNSIHITYSWWLEILLQCCSCKKAELIVPETSRRPQTITLSSPLVLSMVSEILVSSQVNCNLHLTF